MTLKDKTKHLHVAAVLIGLLALAGNATRAEETNRRAAILSADTLRPHIEYLASNELRGRGSGDAGNEAAARYIAAEFKKYGLKPIGTSRQKDIRAPMDGSGYFQPFSFLWGRVAGKNTTLEIQRNGTVSRYRAGRDIEPASPSSSGSAEGKVVFAGYGIRAPQANHDDYKDLDVKGKVVCVLAGSPKTDPQQALANFASAAVKVRTARDLGATAVLLILSREQELAPNLPLDNFDAGLPALRVRYATAEGWFKSAGYDLGSVWQEADNGTTVSQTTEVQVRLTVEVKKVEKVTANIVGLVEGSDPILKNEYVVLGAHMDHLGMGEVGSLNPTRRPAIHNGADDNASGTAGVLQLGAYFGGAQPRPKRSLVLMCFSGEERGLLGSAYYVNHPLVPLDKTVAMLNMDMIGRLRDNKLVVGGTGTAKEWNTLLNEVNQSLHLNIARSDSGFGASDHQSFYIKNLPVLFFFTGLHEDYHKPSDTAEKINYDDAARIVRMVAAMTEKVGNASERPTFQKMPVTEQPTMRARTGRVYFGSVPGYGFEGEGVLLDGVRPGSPAEKAGIKAGDVIIQFGDKVIKNIEDYTAALGAYKPGDEVKVVVKRNGERVTLTAILTERRG